MAEILDVLILFMKIIILTLRAFRRARPVFVILFLMVGWLVGLATGDVNMSPVVVLDHFGVPWGFPGGPWGSLGGPWGSLGPPRDLLGGPWGSPGCPREVPGRSLGVPRDSLGGAWASLGGRWAPLGPPQGRQGPPGTSLEALVGAMSALKNIEKTMFFLVFPGTEKT